MISLSPIQSTPAAQSAAAGTSRLLHRNINVHHLSSFFPLHHHHRHSRRRCSQGLRVRAIDSAQPYDLEAHMINRLNQSTRLKIAIIGFGNFGQFLAKAFIRQGHTVYAHSRSNYISIAESIGATFFSDPHDLCDQHPDVMVICTSIISTESVLESLPLQRLRRNTLFADVLSVKEFSKNIFLQVLPAHFDILCTHPMFGPESGKHSWQNLPFVFDMVRVGDDDSRLARVDNFLNIFNEEGCRMVEMSCKEHDMYAAGTQFNTHTIGRILETLQLQSTPINTKGYKSLLDLVENTAGDSFDLYYGLFKYNENSMEQLERLDLAIKALKKELFGYKKAVVREVGRGNSGQAAQAREFIDAYGTISDNAVSCEKHDKYAEVQFITLTIGMILKKLQLESTPINTKGYESLLDLVENTASDSFDMYYDLFKYNENSMRQLLERLDLAFEALKKELFDFEEAVVRKVGGGDSGQTAQARDGRHEPISDNAGVMLRWQA